MQELKNGWLNEVAKSEETRRNYTGSIERFLEYTETTLEEIAKEWDSIETYRQEKMFRKKWKRVVKTYKNHLLETGQLLKSSVDIYCSAVNSFFSWYEIPVRVKITNHDVTYHNRDINVEEIDEIITHTPEMRDKAYYSMMKDSGLRPVVIKRLQYIDMKKDWEAEVTPCKIDVPKEKNKGQYKKHYTFIGVETVEYLRKYFNQRYGVGSNPSDEDLVFSQSLSENIPINTESENHIFCRIAMRLGIAKKRNIAGKRKAITQYALRKFFRNNANNPPEVDSVDVHFWMGHKLGMNDEHYFSAQNIEKFRRKYAKAYEYLKVSSAPDMHKEKVKYLEAKLEQTEKEMEKRIQEQVQKQIRGIISEELHKIAESDPQTTHVVEDFIHTQFNVNPERVSYSVAVSEDKMKTITVLGYWRNNKYIKLESPATITTK